MIERRIIIGLITSTKFLNQVKDIWSPKLIGSSTAKRISGWCWEYYNEFNKAPGRNIEDIFFTKLQLDNIPKDIAEEFEEDILPGLSQEFEERSVNVKYLVKKTKKYFRKRSLSILQESIEAHLEKGEVKEAEQLASEYKPLLTDKPKELDFSNKESLFEAIDNAFNQKLQNVIYYPRQLGEFFNDHLIRGGLVGFLASEKRGKTWMLLDLAMRAIRQGKKVAFFQAGDMNETQQLLRLCIYITKKSNKEKYCGDQWEAVRDCIYNQNNTCDLVERECDFGIFEGMDYSQIRKDITKEDLIEQYELAPDYKPCSICDDYKTKPIGVPWLVPINVDGPLEANEAKNALEEFFIKNKRNFKLSTHPNETLSINKAERILNQWEKDGFIPHVIMFDYGDIMIDEYEKEERNKQNKIWKGFRRLSQSDSEPLVISPSQSDADSYDRKSLKLKNFSEDKRKYAHATAWFGLNQDPDNREKRIGLMRISELLLREGENNGREITVIQNLKRGRPFLGSYW